MKTIQEYLSDKGYNVASDETTSHIDEWMNWYEGYVKDFHHYTVYNGIESVGKDRYALGMAKTVAEDWANLLLNEKVKIYTGKDFDKQLQEVFEYNNFRVKGNQLIELAFALGTGAFVEYKDADGKVVIDFIRAGMIYPLSWDNGYVNECAFGSVRERDGKKQYYIQIHKMQNKKYIIENHLVNADSGTDIELDKGMLDVVPTGISIPLFQIITPNIVNNIDLDSPYGISVYANGVDQLKGCDLVFDSYMNEFELGKRKIMVPLSMAKIQMGTDGVTKPVFDKNDSTFYAIPGDRDGNLKIDTYDPQIRAEDHDKGINKALDLLSFKCGMGTGRYKFENGNVKTATEVISDKSELYQSLKKHEIVLDSAFKSMVKAIGQLLGKEIKDVNIDFDDSIIEDKQSERQTDKGDIAIGAMTLLEYRMKWYGETEEEAAKNINEPAEMIP
ncbi:MAG: Phage minor capsid protein [Herbinix sp.]|jgi:A118 family predicted phage portal protein|nr:Phage minor capsid protein [Herbinix sp.]